MGTEIAIGISVAVAAFVLSFSIILNFVFIVGLAVSIMFTRNLLQDNARLQNEMTELDSQLIMSDSMNDIIEHLLDLRDELYEITQMELYTGEPVIQGLLERITMTLEKIESSVINQEYLKSLDNNG